MKKGIFLIICLIFGLVSKVEADTSGFWLLKETKPKDTGTRVDGPWTFTATASASAGSAVITATLLSDEPITLSTSWSNPPSTIEPSISSNVQINLTATLISIWNQNSQGRIGAFIDVPGLDPGYITGGATRLTDQNGKESAEVYAGNRTAALTVSGNMPSGSTSFKYKSIYVSSISSGGIALVEYVYEWITPSACTGDCDGKGAVTVDEILLMVNIALGNTVTACDAGDANHDGQITVDEILTAVNNALNGSLNGCSG
jgi:hypothetical protein